MRSFAPVVRSSALIGLAALGLCACSTSSNSVDPAPGAPSPDADGGAGPDTVEAAVPPPVELEADAATVRRVELAEAMATNRVARYSEAWTVLADGARVAPGRIRLFYTRRIIDEANRASGSDATETDFWNREHVWPRSFGLDDTAVETDLHNHVPVDMTVNSARSNRVYDDDGRAHRECGGCLIGEGSWAAYRFGRLSTLLRWHCEDPVSVEEVRRHEAAARVQGNRNAFVDAPELVDTVYGTSCT